MCYIELVVKESDNNIKLIVLDRLFSLKENPAQEKILQDLVMDILRVLSSTDLEVRKKALKLVSELVTSRTVDEVRGSTDWVSLCDGCSTCLTLCFILLRTALKESLVFLFLLLCLLFPVFCRPFPSTGGSCIEEGAIQH